MCGQVIARVMAIRAAVTKLREKREPTEKPAPAIDYNRMRAALCVRCASLALSPSSDARAEHDDRQNCLIDFGERRDRRHLETSRRRGRRAPNGIPALCSRNSGATSTSPRWTAQCRLRPRSFELLCRLRRQNRELGLLALSHASCSGHATIAKTRGTAKRCPWPALCGHRGAPFVAAAQIRPSSEQRKIPTWRSGPTSAGVVNFLIRT